MQKSRTIRYKDFSSKWYKKWSKVLRQEEGINPTQRVHNKLWQNAIIMQALDERGYLKPNKTAVGFGVGIERVPSALASLGVKVTATDQDFENGKKGGWDNGQLAHSGSDLNMYEICPPDLFEQNVTYKNCDMNKIQPSLRNKYDIVWSNCALGHLGSIENGLKFIEQSLKCLKPGGIAVHTTEINVLSDDKTVDSGGTVIFRLKDIAQLFYKLRKQGYICSPLVFDFGTTEPDMNIGFHPYTSENLLKIHVGGHVLSQIVLIIQKPTKKLPDSAVVRKKLEQKLNTQRQKSFLARNAKLRQYLKDQESLSLSGPRSTKPSYEITLKPGETEIVRVTIKNFGDYTFYDQAHSYHTQYPLVIVTADPVNGDSKFATKDWFSKNRPAVYFHPKKGHGPWGAIRPNAQFYVDVPFKAPKKPGIYKEKFCLALEGRGILEDSEFTVKIKTKA